MSKKNKNWQEKFKNQDQPWKTWQQALIAASIAFIPFFFFIMLPMATRNHIINEMKISPELLDHVPPLILLPATPQAYRAMKINMKGTVFSIPYEFSPVSVSDNMVRFRLLKRLQDSDNPDIKKPTVIARDISISVSDQTPKMDLTNQLLVRWFMPQTMLKYLELSLRATWHPIRLLCKAQILLGEGIVGKILEARWDVHHRGFIFPLPAQSGFLARVFRTNGPGYFEFMMKDDLGSISFSEWAAIATRISPPDYDSGDPESKTPGRESLPELIQMVSQGMDNRSKAVETALNNYFRTGNHVWIVPIILDLSKQGFYRETIELYKKFRDLYWPNRSELAIFVESFQKALSRAIKTDMEIHVRNNSMLLFAENLTNSLIRDLNVKIAVDSGDSKRSFDVTLFNRRSLHGNSSVTEEISMPKGIELKSNDLISWTIEGLILE